MRYDESMHQMDKRHDDEFEHAKKLQEQIVQMFQKELGEDPFKIEKNALKDSLSQLLLSMNLQDGQVDKGKGGIKEFRQNFGNVKGAYYIPRNYIEDDDEADIKFDHLYSFE